MPFFCFSRFVSGDGSYRAQTQKQLKGLKNHSKLTFRGQPESDAKMTPKWLKSGSWVIFASKIESHFWVTLVSFLSHFQVDPKKPILSHLWVTLPSDTKLLLTKNYSEIIIFEKLRISRVISGKSLSFPEILRVQIPSKITKNNSRGIIFVIISRRRVISLSSLGSVAAVPTHNSRVSFVLETFAQLLPWAPHFWPVHCFASSSLLALTMNGSPPFAVFKLNGEPRSLT